MSEHKKDFLPLLTEVVKSLVEYPDQVEITASESFHHTIYSIKTSQPDVGKIIGRQGRTAEAIKLLISNMGARNHQKIMVDFYTYDERPAVARAA